MDDFGDVVGFEKPTTSVERFLDQNPRYGEQVSTSLKALAEQMGKKAGLEIHGKLMNVGKDVSNRYGDALMATISQALVSNLPDYVDKTDAAETIEEDDVDMETTFEVMMYFAEAMMPYVASAPSPLSEGLDWGFPASFSDIFMEEYPNTPETPK
jgi:hypothetical protein